LTQMNKCRHCGVFVPIEKAFCPNCSEPIEPEEAPNRATTSSSDMMATLRDDPDNYKDLLSLKKSITSSAQRETPAPGPVPTAQSVAGHSFPDVSREIAPPVKGSNRNLVLGIVAVSILILILVILLALKVF
jgi:hypothetical protein